MSQGLNSCQTSKRGIADKPQCPSNSFRLQIFIAFTIESGKPFAYCILSMRIFLLEQILFIFLSSWASTSKVVRWGPQDGGESARHLPLLFPFPAIQKCASHRPSRTHNLFRTPPNNSQCTGSMQSKSSEIKTRSSLEWRMKRAA